MGAIEYCNSLEAVYSYIEEPFAVSHNFYVHIFQPESYPFTSATLYVPAGTKSLYEATEGWQNFANIVEMEKPATTIPEEAVDLGLPSGTKWSPWNVGASKPEDYGGYYACGETEEKDDYDWSTYIHCDGTEGTCHDIGSNISGTQYDVAHVKWGGSWRMPTRDEIKELYDNCTYEWTELNGVRGGKFTSRKNGNWIFLPAAGGRLYDELRGEASSGCYWSGTLNESSANFACNLIFNDGHIYWDVWGFRFYGQSVRPVISTISDSDLEPLTEDEPVQFDEEGGIDETTDLDGNIVGNLFFNISSENGGYDAAENCIVINNATSEEVMAGIEDKAFFDPDLREQFTGIILKVPAGSGTLKVTAETTGNMVLKVKVGAGAPMEMELEGKLKISFPYSVTEETLVYLYAGETVEAKGRFHASGDGSLKIYGIEIDSSGADAIDSVEREAWKVKQETIYNLQGQRLAAPQKGLNIIGGKKVLER